MSIEKFFLLFVYLLGSLRLGCAWNHVRPTNTFVGLSVRRSPLIMKRSIPVAKKASCLLVSNRYQRKWNRCPTRNAVQDYVTQRQAISEESAEGEPSNPSEGGHKEGWWSRIKGYFLQEKKDDDLTFKQRLAKMGVATVLSYGMISNLSYAILISLAWYGFAVQTGKTPLAPGQWKPFLGVYAGFWVFNNVIRPLRLGLSIAIAPTLDKLVLFFQKRLNVSKPLAITVTVLFVNVIGTTVLMAGGIALASLLAGVPVFPPR